MAKILVIRLSALGDVVMAVPVVHAFALQYPQHQITVLSQERMAAYFGGLPSNVTFRGIHLKHYKGLRGLFRLFQELKKEHFDKVADFHDVLRTKVLRALFGLEGIPVRHIHKGRAEKKALTRSGRKSRHQLKTSFQRYADVLEALGLPVHLTYHPQSVARSFGSRQEKWIGIAPFAAHPGKVYPPDKMEKVVSLLSAIPHYKIYLFGFGEKEKTILEKWEASWEPVQSTVGKLSAEEELALIGQLDVMVSMDSANMHLASLKGVPVVSIWGATHPFAGFLGWGQSLANAVQADLPCRPCSIYGNNPCLRSDYACLNQILPETIVKHIVSLLS